MKYHDRCGPTVGRWVDRPLSAQLKVDASSRWRFHFLVLDGDLDVFTLSLITAVNSDREEFWDVLVVPLSHRLDNAGRKFWPVLTKDEIMAVGSATGRLTTLQRLSNRLASKD